MKEPEDVDNFEKKTDDPLEMRSLANIQKVTYKKANQHKYCKKKKMRKVKTKHVVVMVIFKVEAEYPGVRRNLPVCLDRPPSHGDHHGGRGEDRLRLRRRHREE